MQSKHANVASQLIDVLFIRLRVKYVLFGDRHMRELRLFRHSLTALVMHFAAVHSMFCLIIAFIPSVNTTKMLLRGGRIIHGGLSMTEVYTRCTALFIVRRRTPARCK